MESAVSINSGLALPKDGKKRIQWVDVAKFLGIFAIYLGHFGKSGGGNLQLRIYLSRASVFLFVGLYEQSG